MPVSLPVSLSPTQFDAMLIRLLLISRIVLLPQTFEMYTPFNLFCRSGVVGWMPDKNWIVFPLLQHDAILMSLVCLCLCVTVCVYNCLSVNVCVTFRVWGQTQSAAGKMETGQDHSAYAHTVKASVLCLKTSITACSTHASEDTE